MSSFLHVLKYQLFWVGVGIFQILDMDTLPSWLSSGYFFLNSTTCHMLCFLAIESSSSKQPHWN